MGPCAELVRTWCRTGAELVQTVLEAVVVDPDGMSSTLSVPIMSVGLTRRGPARGPSDYYYYYYYCYYYYYLGRFAKHRRTPQLCGCPIVWLPQCPFVVEC